MEGHRGGGAETLALDLGRADTHDADAFADALVGLVPAAVRLGRALGLSSDGAADAVQEAVGLVWRHRDQLRGAIQSWVPPSCGGGPDGCASGSPSRRSGQ
jgi:hypothetical protein